MDPDLPQPSIERDELPHASDRPPEHAMKYNQKHPITRDSLSAATATPLPPSSPSRSPSKSPVLQRHVPTSQQTTAPAHSQKPSASSPLNPDRRSVTPRLQSRQSSSSLRAFQPSSPSRRSSTTITSGRSGTAMSDRYEEPPAPLTANKIAQDHFKEEIESHATTAATKTVIVLHDACFGHRYSRPRATKAVLSTIVERPERIRAGILGLSTAYVRLGQRHAKGRYAPKHEQKPTGDAPFKFHKTARTMSLASPAAIHIHGQKWMEELGIMCDTAESKLTANGKELARPEGTDKDENGIIRPKFHEGDLYLCSESRDALEGCLGGVCEGIDQVFDSSETSRAFVCIRPPGHHCSADFPSGFCWLNNVHVGIAHAAMNHGLTHAAIIDFDLHHGDGSQAIAWSHNSKLGYLPKNAAPHKKTPIGYYSLHDINSYPCEFGDEEKVRNASLCIENAHGQSIWNVHLEPWKTHQDFWRLYESRYIILLEKARLFLRHHTARLAANTNGPKPKAAIFLSAGFDASEWEGAGMQRHKVNVPTDFYAKFTADVVKLAEEEGLGVDGRVISVLEGGYSDRALTSGILSHVCGLTCGSKAASMVTDPMSLERTMAEMQLSDISVANEIEENILKLDTDWWAPHNLEALEARITRGDAPPPPKKLKEIVPGNYSSPTQASVARSISGTHRDRTSFSGEVGIARQLESKPEQPPPEVDWVTAAVELSRLIIPTDRTTTSCRHDELNAEATKARKARQSGSGLPETTNGEGEKKMQLRERKARAPTQDPEIKLASKTNRRKTIAAVHDINGGQPDGNVEGRSINGQRLPSTAHRRVSDASSIISGFGSMQLDDKSDASSSRPQSRDTSTLPENSKPPPPKAPVIKKARPVTTSTSRVKPPASGRTSPRRLNAAPPIPQIPAVHREGSTTARRPSQPPILTTTNMRAATPSNMDDLASSVGKLKINLKVPTPEENAVREKERAKAQPAKEKKPRAARKPAVPKAPKPLASKKAATNVTAPVLSGSAVTSVPTELTFKQPRTVSTGPPILPTSSAPVPEVPIKQSSASDAAPAPNPMPKPEAASNAPVVPPTVNALDRKSSEQIQQTNLDQSYTTQPTEETEQKRGPSIADLINPPINVTSLPLTSAPVDQPTRRDTAPAPAPPPSTTQSNSSNTTSNIRPSSSSHSTSTPSQPNTPPTVKRTKADLPVFTSHSPIPFGKPSVPGTVSHAHPQSSSRPSSAGQPLSSSADIQRASPFLKQEFAAAKDEAKSIWDVPETPQR